MIVLVGADAALLEGLAQALSHTGQRVAVATSLDDGEELLSRHAPLLTVVERDLFATEAGGAFLRQALGVGSALVAYRGAADTSRPLSPALARHVLADLVLPLERNRLVALAEHLASRARAVGRNPDVTPRGPSAS